MKNKFTGFLVPVLLVVMAFLPSATTLGARAPAPQDQSDRLEKPGTTSRLAESDRGSTPYLIESALASKEISQEMALLYMAYALSDYEKLPARFRSEEPWEGTLTLLALKESLPKVSNTLARAEIEAVLSSSCGLSNAALPNSLDSDHFHLEYDQIGGGLSINDYVNTLEHTRNVEIEQFGWAVPPVSPANPFPAGRYLVRLEILSGGLFGYVATNGTSAGFVGDNPSTSWTETTAMASCMVLNSDYSSFPSGSLVSLQSTVAHEYQHSIQFGYGVIGTSNAPDSIFTEGGATWMEDEVFDSSNDNYNYLWPDFRLCMGQYTASPYSYWIVFRSMIEHFGTGVAGGSEDVMQDFWEISSQNVENNLGAMDAALKKQGTSLAKAFHNYAIATRFNKACSDGYTAPFCLKEGPDYVDSRGAPLSNGLIENIGQTHSATLPDNFSLNWIDLPIDKGPFSIALANTSQGGIFRASLVCDTGNSLEVTPFPAIVKAGETTFLDTYDPKGCNSLVAVITNQKVTADNPNTCDAQGYMLSLDMPGEARPGVVDPVRLYLPLVFQK